MDAITLLLENRASRSGRLDAKSWNLLMLAFALPAFFFWVCWGAGLASYLVAVATLVLLVLPLHHLATEVSLLDSLRRGRCLEELLTAGVEAHLLIDSLPRHALRTLIPRLGCLMPILFVGGMMLPLYERALVLKGLLLWLPAVATFLFLGSYICQGWLLNPREMGPRAFLAVLPLTVATEPAAGCGLLLFFAGVYAWWGRTTAIDALLHPPAPQVRKLAHRGGWKKTLLGLKYAQNPIVMREWSKLTGTRLLFWIFAPLVLVGLWPSTGAVLTISLLFLAGAAAVSVNAVPGEREGKTLDALIQSGLSLRGFLQGWLWAVALPRMVALIPVLLMTPFLRYGDGRDAYVCGSDPELHWFQVSQDFWQVTSSILATLALQLAPVAGVLLGLWAGSLVGERRRARGHLLTGLLAGGGLLSALWGGLALGTWGIFHQLLDLSTPWFDDEFLFGLSPLLAVVLGCLFICLGSGAVLKKRMTPLWAGREPVAESSAERAILYCEGALNSLWGPGALCLLPALAGALGLIWDEFHRWDDELIWGTCLFVGIGLMSVAGPWLLMWRPASKLWDWLGEQHWMVSGPLTFGLGMFLGLVSVFSFLLVLAIADGPSTDDILAPGMVTAIVASLLAAVRMGLRRRH